MEKSPDAFRTISEVAAELDVPQHVLRFWETKFPQVNPMKRAGGRRYYRPQDVELLGTIKQLLYAQGFTIKGVQRILKERGVRVVCTASREGMPIASAPLGQAAPSDEKDSRPSSETEDASPTSAEAGSAEKTGGDFTESEPGSVESSARSAPDLSLSAADVETLRGILSDLERCANILVAARQAGAPCCGETPE